jgi:tetratricopeptide (TPR) repeat protein
MSEQFEHVDVEDALAAALRVSAAVKNADGYDELAAAIADRYAKRADFNRAVEIADSINDPYTMEKTLAEIAVALAAAGQEDGALELIASLEDYSHQATAQSQIAVAHAMVGEFDLAMEIASQLDDSSGTVVEIAYQCVEKGEYERAIEIVDDQDFPLGSVGIRNRIAQEYFRAGRVDEAIELLTLALEQTESIEAATDRAGALSELALGFADAGLPDKAAEILSQATEVARESEDVYRDSALSQVASGHARLRQYDTAVSITESIDDVYLATGTLIDLAIIEHDDAARHAEALLLLSDAYVLVAEDEPQTQRDEVQHNHLVARIASSFANFGDVDQALKAARFISSADLQFWSLSQVAMRFAESGEFENAITAVRAIEDESYKTNTLIRVGRSMIASGKQEQGIPVLTEAARAIESLEQPFDKVQASANLAVAYAEAAQDEHIAPLITETVHTARSITDAHIKASALMFISDACTRTAYEMNEEMKDMLWGMSAD